VKITDVGRTSFGQKPLNFIVGVVVGDGWNRLSVRESTREVGRSRWVSAGAEMAMRITSWMSAGSHSEKRQILDSLRILSKPGPVGGRDVGFGFGVYRTTSLLLMTTTGSQKE
jgi:hypothetical protein